MCLIDIILIVLFPVDKSFIAKSIVEVLRWPHFYNSQYVYANAYDSKNYYGMVGRGFFQH